MNTSCRRCTQYDATFFEGMQFCSVGNREAAWIYTDGSLKHSKPSKVFDFFKEVGVMDSLMVLEVLKYMNPATQVDNHIAPIETFAILRELAPFGPTLYGSAAWLFCDNTHSVGCLLRRSSMIRQETRTRPGPDSNSNFSHPKSNFMFSQTMCGAL